MKTLYYYFVSDVLLVVVNMFCIEDIVCQWLEKNTQMVTIIFHYITFCSLKVIAKTDYNILMYSETSTQ